MRCWRREFRRSRVELLSGRNLCLGSGSVRRKYGSFVRRWCRTMLRSNSRRRRSHRPQGDSPVVCSRCGASVSLWNRDLSTGLCPQCRKADRQAAEAQAAELRAQAEREAEAARQIAAEKLAAGRKLSGQDQRDEFRAKCPVCGDNRSRPGRAGERSYMSFKPSENWFSRYPLEALACLRCGHIRLFLNEEGRSALDSGSPPADQQHG